MISTSEWAFCLIKKGNIPHLAYFLLICVCKQFYLFTWNFLFPVLKKSTIWLAAAIPALMLASSV